jgi:hypothetical protein
VQLSLEWIECREAILHVAGIGKRREPWISDGGWLRSGQVTLRDIYIFLSPVSLESCLGVKNNV